MTALGHERRFGPVETMSGSPFIADIEASVGGAVEKGQVQTCQPSGSTSASLPSRPGIEIPGVRILLEARVSVDLPRIADGSTAAKTLAGPRYLLELAWLPGLVEK